MRLPDLKPRHVRCPKCHALPDMGCKSADNVIKIGADGRLTKCHRERALLARRINRIHDLVGNVGVCAGDPWPERAEIEFVEATGDEHERAVAIEVLSLLDDTKYDGEFWEAP